MNFYINRYKDIEEKEYSIEVVTPMFLGGADQKQAEFRIPSLKGVLRFWWRALYGKKCKDLHEMKDKESKVFGDTKTKSSFSLMVEEDEIKISNRKLSNNTFDVINYLSYGTSYKSGTNKVYRSFIKEKEIVKIKLILYNSENYEKEIINSFFTTSLFGGLGLKSRNGFGSFKIKNDNYDMEINNIIRTDYNSSFLIENNIPNLNSKTRIFKTDKYDNWVDALRVIGGIYRDLKKEFNMHKKLKELSDKYKWERFPKHYFLRVSKLNDNKYIGKIIYLYYGPDEIIKIYEEMNNMISEDKNLLEMKI